MYLQVYLFVLYYMNFNYLTKGEFNTGILTSIYQKCFYSKLNLIGMHFVYFNEF